MTEITPTRRRFITIAAAAAGLPLVLHSRSHAATAPGLRVWTGIALGADAMLQIAHPDPAAADRLIALSLREVERLERVFSLYRPDSALVRLNRDGMLADPPADLLRLMSESLRFSQLTEGAFDVTVQPLWDVYASHFRRPDADPAGPLPAAIAAAVARVGSKHVILDEGAISLARPGMAVTLNGIAQGYITDRVVERLREAGVEHALVDMGETRALGGHPDGGPWRIGLANAGSPSDTTVRVGLQDRAISTSGAYGTQFDVAGRFNHIFDPASGATSWRYRSVSVIAPDATTADALSTAFSLMELKQTSSLVRELGLSAYFGGQDQQLVVQRGGV